MVQVHAGENKLSHMLRDVTHTFISENRVQGCVVRPVARSSGPWTVQGPFLSGPWTAGALCLLKRSPFAQKKLASGMWERQSCTRSRGRTARVHGPRGYATCAVDAAVLPSSLCRIVHSALRHDDRSSKGVEARLNAGNS